MKRHIFVILVALSTTSALGYCLFGEESDAAVEKRWRGCIGEVGVMAPFGMAGRALEIDYLYGGLRLGAAAARDSAG